MAAAEVPRMFDWFDVKNSSSTTVRSLHNISNGSGDERSIYAGIKQLQNLTGAIRRACDSPNLRLKQTILLRTLLCIPRASVVSKKLLGNKLSDL